MRDRSRRQTSLSIQLSSHIVAALLLGILPALATAQGNARPAHPVIPGFERFYTGAKADTVKGGRLLLAELNCTSCHQPSAEQKSLLLTKQAPILSDAGSRIKRAYLKKFLSDPHGMKPGTAMPDVFAGLPAKEKAEKVEALVHLLASTGTLAHEPLKPNMVGKGQKLYHELGCVACHGSRDNKGGPDKLLPTSVPLTILKDKYSLPSLTAFLEDPHQTRPSGRMPGLVNNAEAREVASFLLQGIPGPPANLTYAYYEGDWTKLPDFTKLKPVATGEASSFDINLKQRNDHFALTFEGFLKIDTDGDYKFYTTSDDGSRLWINGKLVVDNDGVHAPATKSGTIKLAKGMHKLEVAMFEQAGGEEIAVQFQGPKVKMQSVAPFVYLTPQGNPVVNAKEDPDEDFAIKPDLVARGAVVFSEVGCASCHQLKHNGKELVPAKSLAPALAQLKTEGGCLSAKPAKQAPHFALTPAQQQALAAGIKDLAQPAGKTLSVKEDIQHTLVTFNCTSCHTRDKFGGVEDDLNSFFKVTQQEMGDEGRLPPPLDGVGAKLKQSYMKKMFDQVTDDRPYMLTRMPKFGLANAGHLVEAFAQTDKLAPVKIPDFPNLASTQIKSQGRHMVGAKAFGCIKCHTFAGQKAEGVQGMDMTIMTERVKQDWFHHYLIDPQKFRPGTRMPTSWPNGQSQLPNILGGDTSKQVEAIWVYLDDGKKAWLPIGLGTKFIELVPEKDAIIYRNFISGGGSRAIGVGYPEKVSLAFDANKMSLALLWQGPFIDAAKHWTDRGVGYQVPLGDNVLSLPTEAPFAALVKETDPWPKEPAKQLGYKFLGYKVTPDERPTFLYAYSGVKIEDFPNAIEGKPNPSLKRTLTLTAEQGMKPLWFRAAVGKIAQIEKGLYAIDGKWKMHIEAAAEPVIRQVGANQELLVPVQFKDKKAVIVQQFVW